MMISFCYFHNFQTENKSDVEQPDEPQSLDQSATRDDVNQSQSPAPVGNKPHDVTQSPKSVNGVVEKEQSDHLTASQGEPSDKADSENGQRILSFEKQDLESYELCMKSVVKLLVGEQKLNKWMAVGE